jgi:hypothetical protein
MPYAKHLEDEALPQAADVVEAALRSAGEAAPPVPEAGRV